MKPNRGPGVRPLDKPRPSLPGAQLGPLDRRQREVCDGLLNGWGNQAIANRLCINKKTVSTYIRRAKLKLGAADTIHLIALWRDRREFGRDSQSPYDLTRSKDRPGE